LGPATNKLLLLSSLVVSRHDNGGKEDKMTKQLLKSLVAVGIVAVVAAASVPVEAAEVSCRIPFSFTVNGKTLPEGNYSVSTSTATGTLFIRGYGTGAFVMTNRVDSRQPSEAKLVFHKYGDQYILRQVWMGGNTARELPQPPVERSLAKGAPDRKVAGFEEVVIPIL
jgi:hypothetical protein